METFLRQQGLERIRTITESSSNGRGLYQVKQSTLGLVYALKRVPAPRGHERVVLNEVTAINRMPFGVAPHCHRFLEHGGSAYLLLDWIDGPSLTELFKQPASDLNDLIHRLRVLSLIAARLTRVHAAGLTHRDIKPDNVIVSDNPSNPKEVHLVDFGLSVQNRLYEEGTVGYRAPEQEMNRGLNISKATDVYGVGQTGWYLLTASPYLRTPNERYDDWAPSAQPFLPSFVPKTLVDVLLKATAFNPKARYASAMDLARSLTPIINNTGRPR